MMSFLALSLLALLGSASAQLTTCVNAGYDLTSITGKDLYYTGTGGGNTAYPWAIRPCGLVNTTGFCTSLPGQFCQATTTVSTLNFTLTNPVVPTSSPLWGQVYMNGQYGVAQYLADGNSCGGNVGDREGTIVFLCNTAATTPYISSILELAACQYEAIIQTAAICSQVPSTGISQTAGTSVINGLCGGGIYDLTAINGSDIIGVYNGNTWAIRSCGVLAVRNCSDVTASVCQYNSGNPGNAIARYNPLLEITFWEYLAPGALSQISQNGDAACTNQYRYSNITYVCNAAATTPIFISALEPLGCHYYITIQTAVVCGTAFTIPLPPAPPAMSSTGSAAPPATISCVNAGYDLTTLTGSDLFFTGTGGGGSIYAWALRPCGTVTTPGYCGGEFCQSTTTLSNSNVTATGVLVGALWGQIQMNGQNGVAQYLQDGTDCGGNVGDREGTIIYLCNAAATTPYVSSVLETTTCHYQAVVQTAAICSQVPSTGVSHTPGTPIISTQCGGGIYDLSSLTSDIVGTSGPNTWAIRACGALATNNCTTGASVCQSLAFTNGTHSAITAGTYQPASVATFYQYLAPGAVSQIYRDGPPCGSQMRLVNVTYVCNAAATTPVFASAVESPACNFQLTVQTAATCGTAFGTQPAAGSSSSTGTTVRVVSSSSAATASNVVSSSSSAVPAVGVSSSSSRTAGVSSATSVQGVSSVSSGSATIAAPTSAPSTNPGGNGASSTAASALAVVACALLALVMA